jgi:hypothetical protein
MEMVPIKNNKAHDNSKFISSFPKSSAQDLRKYNSNISDCVSGEASLAFPQSQKYPLGNLSFVTNFNKA